MKKGLKAVRLTIIVAVLVAIIIYVWPSFFPKTAPHVRWVKMISRLQQLKNLVEGFTLDNGGEFPKSIEEAVIWYEESHGKMTNQQRQILVFECPDCGKKKDWLYNSYPAVMIRIKAACSTSDGLRLCYRTLKMLSF